MSRVYISDKNTNANFSISIAALNKNKANGILNLPRLQYIFLKAGAFPGVGETADFEFTPLKADTHDLKVIILEGQYIRNQKWIVTD